MSDATASMRALVSTATQTNNAPSLTSARDMAVPAAMNGQNIGETPLWLMVIAVVPDRTGSDKVFGGR